jgi:CelD/BcsL family acetyltransferase involved in cellulose biosynthesis
VCTVNQLARHADAWDRLALTASEQLPMLSYTWVAAYLEHCLDAHLTWRCLFAYDGHELIGVLPVINRRRVFGARFDTPFDAETRSGHALSAIGREPEVLTAFLDYLAVLEPRYNWIWFHGIRNASRTFHAARAINARTVTVGAAAGRASVIPTRGSLAVYEKGLNTNFRRNLRKAHNRSTRDHEAKFRTFAAPDAASPHLLQQFLDLEAAGWKGAAGTAIKCEPHLLAFYSTLARGLSDRGWLEWHFLEFDGEPAAGIYAVRFGRSLVLPKVAYNEKYARLGPGNLLLYHVIARSYADDGIDEINCLTDMPWHDSWQVEKDEYSDMLITPYRFRPVVVGMAEIELPAAVLHSALATSWLVSLVRKAKAMWRVNGRKTISASQPR